MDPSSPLFGLAILTATLLGPILAVVVTRYTDGRRAAYERKLNVFRTLMATRSVGLSLEKINALNLIFVEFTADRKVIDTWNRLLDSYCKPHPVDEAGMNLLLREQARLTTELLHTMAKILNIKIEKMDIFDKAYLPQFMVDQFHIQSQIQSMLVAIASGERSLPVSIKKN